jgi:hypothetical protein
MRVRVRSLARPIVTLQGESDNLALWINDARFEYGPVECSFRRRLRLGKSRAFPSTLKKGPWAFIFELSERENTWFGLGNELMPRQIGTGIEDEETAGWDCGVKPQSDFDDSARATHG